MDKTILTEDRICTVLQDKLYSMANNENQTEYKPLQLKWLLPIESTQGMISLFENIIFVLNYVQKEKCNRDTIAQIIENEIHPIISEIRDEFDFFMAVAIMAICNVVDDLSNTKELMGLFREIIGKFINFLERASKLVDSDALKENKNKEISYDSNDEIDTSTLVIGMAIKNYKELCTILNEEVKTGKAKQLQLKNWKRYFDWEKDGQKFIIVDIYPKFPTQNYTLLSKL